MSKAEYVAELNKLHPDTLNELRYFVQWAEHVIVSNGKGQLLFKEDDVNNEIYFIGAALSEQREALGPELKDVLAAMDLLKGKWNIVVPTGKEKIVELNPKAFSTFKSAFATVLKMQPHGYETDLMELPKNKRAKVTRVRDNVYVTFVGGTEVLIASAESKAGKLLLLLGNPIGVSRGIESVAETVGVPATKVAIKNVTGEIQRKLAQRGKRNALAFSNDGKTVCLEVA